MSTTTTPATTPRNLDATDVRPIPMTRLVKVELRKMFDTRSGFWLMASIIGLSVLASGAVMIFGTDDDIAYGSFGAAVGIPIGLLLPVMAVLAVTAEWSQRTGLVSFTLVPKRNRVIGAKAVAVTLAAVVSVLAAMGVAAVFNLLAATVRGVPTVWDFQPTDLGYLVLGNLIGVAFGFIWALLIRNSPGAIVAYVAWSFLLPSITFPLAAAQEWFADIQPWIDLGYTSQKLYSQDLAGQDWVHLASGSLIWLGVPLLFALLTLRKAEVK